MEKPCVFLLHSYVLLTGLNSVEKAKEPVWFCVVQLSGRIKTNERALDRSIYVNEFLGHGELPKG